MADRSIKFFDKDTISASPKNSSRQPTRALQGLTFVMSVDTLSGASGDTLDVKIEESDEELFTNTERIRTVASFTQVLGNSSSESLLKQRVDLPTKNIDTWVRAVIETNNVATFTGKVIVGMLGDNKV